MGAVSGSSPSSTSDSANAPAIGKNIGAFHHADDSGRRCVFLQRIQVFRTGSPASWGIAVVKWPRIGNVSATDRTVYSVSGRSQRFNSATTVSGQQHRLGLAHPALFPGRPRRAPRPETQPFELPLIAWEGLEQIEQD